MSEKRSRTSKGIEIAIVAVIIVAIAVLITVRHNRGVTIGSFAVNDTLKIEPNDWQVHSSIKADDMQTVIKVQYDQKYGRTVTIYCRAIFTNEKTKQYRCVAPWIDKLEIERSNMNDISIVKVPVTDVPAKALTSDYYANLK